MASTTSFVSSTPFEKLWIWGLCFPLLDLLCFRDLIRLSQAFPIVCDLLFHDFPISEPFFEKHAFRLMMAQKDYVQSHDCHEKLYLQFIRFTCPSASILPTPLEGFYPHEPYLAWRITSLFAHSPRSYIRLEFYPDLLVQSVCPVRLHEPQYMQFLEVYHSVKEFELENVLTGDYIPIGLQSIMFILFEVLMHARHQIEVAYIPNDILPLPLCNWKDRHLVVSKSWSY